MKRSLFFASLLTCMFMVGACARSEELDAAALIERVVDVGSAATPLFADDGMLVLVDFGSHGNVGYGVIRPLLRAVFDGAEATIIDLEVSDDTATGRIEFRAAWLRPFGVERIVDLFTLKAEDGKITLLRLQFDLTDPQTAQVYAAMEAQPGQGGLPANVIFIPLGPGRDGDQSGTAQFIPDPGGGSAAGLGGFVIQITRGEPGVLQPVHLHSGTCDNLGPIVAPLASVMDGMSETHYVASLLPESLAGGDFAINVHKSEEEHDLHVACGNLGEPLEPDPEQEPLSLAFVELDGSGIGGTATITLMVDGSLRVEVELMGLRGGAKYVAAAHDATSAACGGEVIGSESGWMNTDYPRVSYFVPAPIEDVFSVSIWELDDGPTILRACADRAS